MSIIKVTRKYQVTIPEVIRQKLGVNVGDKVLVTYDEEEGVIKMRLLKRVERTRLKLGRKLTAEEVERAILEGLRKCLDLEQ
ncbi:MAG: AbrB family transcriptional regulator [Candidatus Methanomethylicota archaeon]|uniref:AbrB family transcriptional regulator n=1 Tax=Thermoproteota archaeon TaxID=2056631 RepID=A0A497F2Q0_9CREN|nr:MAG: AbrB family transcriptional regulator [Candidatus Verstraetearchaeota archaeon]